MHQHAAPLPRPEALLTFRGVSLRFGGVTALDGVDCDILPGELFADMPEEDAPLPGIPEKEPPAAD